MMAFAAGLAGGAPEAEALHEPRGRGRRRRGPPPGAAAPASEAPARRRLGLGALAALAGAARAPRPPSPTTAPPPSFTDADILGKPPPYFRIEQVNLRYTHFDQSGTGYQSRAGPLGTGVPFKVKPGRPGSEWETVEQPQAEIIAKQGDRITHRLWVPVDIVTAASPDAIDAVSTASRTQRGRRPSTGRCSTRRARETSLSVRNGLHNEENWRSWNTGFGFSALVRRGQHRARGGREPDHGLVRQVHALRRPRRPHLAQHDQRERRGSRSSSPRPPSPTSTTASRSSAASSRNGWNIVPLTNGDRRARGDAARPASATPSSARVAQWLPWNGAAHAFYRFYVDDWGIRAHTVELELYQRLSRLSYVRLNYRFHRQTGVDFFTTRAAPDFTLATADSDLAALDAHTVGVKVALDVPVRFARSLHVDVAVERYFRSNDLRVSVYSCGFGFLF